MAPGTEPNPPPHDTTRFQSSPAESWRGGRRIAIASAAISAGLATLNLLAGYVTGSTSVLAVGIEFAGDVLAALAVIAGFTLAARPADWNHPYGHGRVETLAGLAVGTALALAGIGTCYSSLRNVGSFHAPPSVHAVWPLLAAIAARGASSIWKFRAGGRIRSAALVADAWNDTVDVLSAAVALAALGLTLFDPGRFLAADHYGGFAVGIVVVVTGVRVMRDASLQLLDTMPSAEVIAEIRAAALAVPGVAGVEKVFARKTGLQYHVDLHLHVDPDITVRQSHAIAGQVRARIRAASASVADVLVHVEPST